MHCQAVTDEGEVFSWGRNDQAQLGDSGASSKCEPTVITALEGKHISGIACGPAQVKFLAAHIPCFTIGKIVESRCFEKEVKFAMSAAQISFLCADELFLYASKSNSVGQGRR